jgi:hypothetical protein
MMTVFYQLVPRVALCAKVDLTAFYICLTSLMLYATTLDLIGLHHLH